MDSSTSIVHLILIISHALSGLISFVSGCFIIKPPASARNRLFQVYYFALCSLLGFMIMVIVYDWPRLSDAERVAFTGLLGLGAYTVWRGWLAKRALTRQGKHWQNHYIGHVGFTLISLFDGFAIVGAIDLKAPAPAVVLAGALGIIAGIVGVNRVKARYGE